MSKRLGDQQMQARVLNNLADVSLNIGEIERAADLQREGLRLCLELGNEENVAFCLEAAAKIVAAGGDPREAASLWGAAESLRRTLGQALPPAEIPVREQYVSRAAAGLESGAFEEAWASGGVMTSSDASRAAMRILEEVGAGLASSQ